MRHSAASRQSDACDAPRVDDRGPWLRSAPASDAGTSRRSGIRTESRPPAPAARPRYRTAFRWRSRRRSARKPARCGSAKTGFEGPSGTGRTPTGRARRRVPSTPLGPRASASSRERLEPSRSRERRTSRACNSLRTDTSQGLRTPVKAERAMLDPSIDCRVIRRQAAFGHHFPEAAIADSRSTILRTRRRLMSGTEC